MRRPEDPECIEVSRERNALARQVLTHIEPMILHTQSIKLKLDIYLFIASLLSVFKMQNSYVLFLDIATPCQTNPPTIFNLSSPALII